MTLADRLGAYAAHPDPLTAACNRISLLVASSQPLYPLYVCWIVGGDWWVAFWTFLSTPLFTAVPALSRRNPLAGRMLLPLAGIANGILSAKAFGTASAVEWFLLPCALISAFALRDAPKAMVTLLALTTGAALLHARYGAPLGHFTPDEYAHFRRLNLYSVAVLSIAILWTFIRARRTTASR